MSVRETRRFTVLSFSSTHDALDAEALLDDLGLEVVPIPAPPSVSAICGIALRLPPEEVSRALEYLDRAGIVVAGQGEMDDV